MRKVVYAAVAAVLVYAIGAWCTGSALSGTWLFRLGDITQLLEFQDNGIAVANEHGTATKDLVKVFQYQVAEDVISLHMVGLYAVESDGSLTSLATEPDETMNILYSTADSLALLSNQDHFVLGYSPSDLAVLYPPEYQPAQPTAVESQSWATVKADAAR